MFCSRTWYSDAQSSYTCLGTQWDKGEATKMLGLPRSSGRTWPRIILWGGSGAKQSEDVCAKAFGKAYRFATSWNTIGNTFGAWILLLTFSLPIS